ncbi:unnamed protein product, partial [Symbiodinium pilosum]
VEKMEPLPQLEQAHLLAMFVILIYMKGQGAILKDVGDTNWGTRRTIAGVPEMVLLDAGSWTSVKALLDQGQLGMDLWRSIIRQRVIVSAPTRDNFVMLPSASAIQQPEDWR